MKKVSPQTKSFIILFFTALIGTFLILRLWPTPTQTQYYDESENEYYRRQSQEEQTKNSQSQAPKVDTASWKTYSDQVLGLSFKYKPDWKVVAAKKAGAFTVLEIDPGLKYYNMKVYVSPTEFYVMDGLPAKTETIAGKMALNVSDALYGIKNGGSYYTFDVGLSMSLIPEFDALVHSVQF